VTGAPPSSLDPLIEKSKRCAEGRVGSPARTASGCAKTIGGLACLLDGRTVRRQVSFSPASMEQLSPPGLGCAGEFQQGTTIPSGSRLGCCLSWRAMASAVRTDVAGGLLLFRSRRASSPLALATSPDSMAISFVAAMVGPFPRQSPPTKACRPEWGRRRGGACLHQPWTDLMSLRAGPIPPSAGASRNTASPAGIAARSADGILEIKSGWW